MYYLKQINGEYDTVDSMVNAINYIFKDKTNHAKNVMWYGSFNIYDIKTTADEMIMIKNYYNEFSGKLILHFIVSFEKTDYFIFSDAVLFANLICGFFCLRHQIVYAVHTDTDNLHIHFILNTISFVDGQRINRSFAEQEKFKAYVNKCYQIVKTGSNKVIKDFHRQENEAWC